MLSPEEREKVEALLTHRSAQQTAHEHDWKLLGGRYSGPGHVYVWACARCRATRCAA